MKHTVIIGNGISGVTAARHIRKNANNAITIISDETEEFFSRTALMYIYMGHMKYEHTVPYEKDFWKKNRIGLVKDRVLTIEHQNKRITLRDGESLEYDDLILATGSVPNKFGWPGQDLPQVSCLYSKQDLDKVTEHTSQSSHCTRAVVVGGGLIGIELAEMLHSRGIAVTFLVREDSFWDGVLPQGDSSLINEHIIKHGIDLRLSSNLKEIKEDQEGNVKAVVIAETGEEIGCQFVGLTTGVSPNIKWLEGSGIETNRGILVDRYLQTNIIDVYAIGDCAEQREAIGNRRPVEAVWYTGRMMGETVAQTICGNRFPYRPGHWFNSAKFFDIEYQTYGWVHAQETKNEKHFHWRHSIEEKCMTVAYDPNTMKFLGINTFGIRLKHQFFDKWLTDQQPVDFVIEHLAEANFDPEFYKHHEKEILLTFRNKTLKTTEI